MADYYQSNELFRYALWGFAAVFIATTVLTIIEYSLFSGSVKDDVGDGFMFGGDEPNWLDNDFKFRHCDNAYRCCVLCTGCSKIKRR